VESRNKVKGWPWSEEAKNKVGDRGLNSEKRENKVTGGTKKGVGTLRGRKGGKESLGIKLGSSRIRCLEKK